MFIPYPDSIHIHITTPLALFLLTTPDQQVDLHAWRIHRLAPFMCVLLGPGCVEESKDEEVGETAVPPELGFSEGCCNDVF
jgi:hypothetical protein